MSTLFNFSIRNVYFWCSLILTSNIQHSNKNQGFLNAVILILLPWLYKPIFQYSVLKRRYNANQFSSSDAAPPSLALGSMEIALWRCWIYIQPSIFTDVGGTGAEDIYPCLPKVNYRKWCYVYPSALRSMQTEKHIRRWTLLLLIQPFRPRFNFAGPYFQF